VARSGLDTIFDQQTNRRVCSLVRPYMRREKRLIRREEHAWSLTSVSLSPLPWEHPMRPRFHVPLTPDDRATIAVWSRRALIVWGCLIASLVVYAFIAQGERGTAQTPKAEPQAQSASHTPSGQR
jgi:hypothetical protein